MPATTINKLRCGLSRRAYCALRSSVRSSVMSGRASSLEISGSLSACSKRVVAGAMGSSGEKHLLQSDTRVRCTHERFTHQEGMDAVVTHQPDVVGAEDAAFCHDPLALGNLFQQVQRVVQRGFECAQVAVVDPEQRGLQL